MNEITAFESGVKELYNSMSGIMKHQYFMQANHDLGKKITSGYWHDWRRQKQHYLIIRVTTMLKFSVQTTS